jgi:hypothetical protein
MVPLAYGVEIAMKESNGCSYLRERKMKVSLLEMR